MHLKQNFAASTALSLLAASLLWAAPLTAAPKTTTVKFNTTRSEIKWLGKKVTGQHDGTIKLKSGKAILTGDQLTGGEFVVDMASLDNSDIADAATKAKLVGHLKSDDFFGVEKHPTAKFVIKSVKDLPSQGDGAPTHEITGDLTIKGHTHSHTFPATIAIREKTAAADATLTVDRTKYDVRYGSGKFFENLGDKTIYDDFTLQMHLEGQR